MLEESLRLLEPALAGGPILLLLAAVAAGVVASAVCPCTLPMGLGVAGVAGTAESEARRGGLKLSAAFCFGIVVNLALLGALAGRLGAILTESFGQHWALGMAAASLAAAALAFAGPRLRAEQLTALRRPGLLGAFSYGFIFSLGTSAAPLLLLLTLAAVQAEPIAGLLLATAFGVGRGLPFLLVGVFAGAAMRFARTSLWRRPLQVVSGSALLMVSGYYVWIFSAFA